MTRASCDVVIVNFHSAAYVEQCVAAFDQSWCRSVVVVDNSASADEVARLRVIDTAVQLSVVVAPGNIGFGAGVNLGVASLAPQPDDLIWVLNPDTKPNPDAAPLLIERLGAGEGDVVTPVLVTGDDADVVWFCGGDIDHRTGRVRHWNFGERHRPGAVTPYETGFLCGAAPLFTGRAWAVLGGFDERLFLYWEDVELSLRAHDHGLRILVVPRAVVWHDVGGTSGEQGQSRSFYHWSARNRAVVMRRRVGRRAVVGPRGLLVTARLVLHPLREDSDRRGKFFAGLVGLWSGLRVSVHASRP